MKNIIFIILSVAVISCTSKHADTIVQVSTIDALLAGYYDGIVPIENIHDYGDFGIGTFDKLDGEMVISGGTVYQFKTDGNIYIPDKALTTPFFTVVKFEKQNMLKVNMIENFKNLEIALDSLLRNKNMFYAIRGSGKISYLKTRSVPSQERPYKPLSEVTKTQTIFERREINGTLIGFRVPHFAAGINVPGYHLHFLSADKKFGGHVLDISFDELQIEIQKVNRFKMMLPDDSDFNQIDFSKNRKEELEKVEK